MEFTDDDVVQCWPHHVTYVVDILNGKYSLEDARNDLHSLVGSKYDPRVLTVKVSGDADADKMNSTHGESYGIDWEYEHDKRAETTPRFNEVVKQWN